MDRYVEEKEYSINIADTIGFIYKPVISLKVLRERSDIVYGIDWFKNYQFNTEELEIIKRKKDEIFLSYGIEND